MTPKRNLLSPTHALNDSFQEMFLDRTSYLRDISGLGTGNKHQATRGIQSRYRELGMAQVARFRQWHGGLTQGAALSNLGNCTLGVYRVCRCASLLLDAVTQLIVRKAGEKRYLQKALQLRDDE